MIDAPAGVPPLEVIAAKQITDRLAATPADARSGVTARLLGFTFAPGTIVRDAITGEIGTVLYASRRAVRR